MSGTRYEYDLAIIGAGSAGVRLSRMAAARGVRVVMYEKAALGGTCVNVGCVPKKLFVYGSELPEQVQIAAGYGWSSGALEHDWPTMIANKNREISRLNDIYARMLDQAGVTLVAAEARVTGPHRVYADGVESTAERIVVATGGWPYVPDIPGAELGITSNEVFYLEDRPERVLVVGGGYIAVEFAGIFNGFGSRTTQLYRGSLFMRGFDDDIRRSLAHEMRDRGIDVRFDTNVTRLERADSGAIVAHLTTGDTLEVDCVLWATGRRPATADLGLKDIGVEMAPDGGVCVDDTFQTSVPSIYALGDVSNFVQLTPVALAEAMVLLENLYGDGGRRMSYELIPTAVFSQPTIGTVGWTEEHARAELDEVIVYTSTFRPMQLTMTDLKERTFMKLLVCAKTDRVVGLHMMGPHAGEIVQGFAVAIKAGATKADFDRTIGIHPTAAEEFVTMRTEKYRVKGIDTTTGG